MPIWPAPQSEVHLTGGGVDDTQALLNALAAATAGRRILRLHGGFLIDPIVWDRPAIIRGDGSRGTGTQIIPRGTSTTAQDLITLTPGAAYTGTGELYFWSIEELQIAGANRCRHGFAMILPATLGSFQARFLMRRCGILGQDKSAFYMTKTQGGSLDGFFTSLIQDNLLQGGANAEAVIDMPYSGDSISILDNTIHGVGIGIRSAPVTGAAHQLIKNNNITARGGAVKLTGAAQAKIRDNQMEQSFEYGGDSGDDAMVVLENCTECDVTGNNMNTHDRVSCVNLKGTSSRNVVRDNVMRVSTAASKKHFVISATAGRRNVLGINRYFTTEAGEVTTPEIGDSSTVPQIGVWKSPTLQNSWIAASSGGSFLEGLFYRVNEDNTLSLKGNISSGTNTAGIVIANLPVGARPSNGIRMTVNTFDGSAWESAPLHLGVAGNITIPLQLLPGTTIVTFDGVRLPLD